MTVGDRSIGKIMMLIYGEKEREITEKEDQLSFFVLVNKYEGNMQYQDDGSISAAFNDNSTTTKEQNSWTSIRS